jgi:outer membrane murein-binding lipoprotein Lpp
MESESKPAGSGQPAETADTKWSKKGLITLIILAVLVLAALSFALYSRHQNSALKADLTSRDQKINTLNSQVKSLQDAVKQQLAQKQAATSKSNTVPKTGTTDTGTTDTVTTPTSNQKITKGVVGKTYKTSQGTLVVDKYEKTSLHNVQSAYTSQDMSILKVSITLTNTNSYNQFYEASQFAFQSSDLTLISNINKKFEPTSYNDPLNDVTMAAGGVIHTTMYFDNYNGKDGILHWTTLINEDVQVALPGV